MLTKSPPFSEPKVHNTKKLASAGRKNLKGKGKGKSIMV